MEKLSITDIRKKNHSDIYHLIYREKRISKQQIANALQLSLPTTTQHLTTLLEEGLIEKAGQLSSGIGRKAVAYAANRTIKVAIGVEILAETVTSVILDLYGNVIHKKSSPLCFRQETAYFEALASIVMAQLQEAHIAAEQVMGAGFGIQGLVAEDGREVLYGKILDCTGLNIAAAEKHLPFPCRFVHDSECAAELELWYRPELTDALYLSLGPHLGGAVISDGKIQTGKTGRTGTFEHMTLVEGGKRCYCGKNGCMECYCSASALLNAGETPEEFFAALRQNSPAHSARWIEYLGWLAMAINNLHMVLDSTIVLGGYIAPYLTEADLAKLFAFIQLRSAFPESESFLQLGVQENDVIAIGAAIPFIREFLAV